MTTTARPDELSIVANRAGSVAEMLRDRVRDTPHLEAYRYPDGEDGWASRTWQQTGDQVALLAAGLIALDIEPQQRIAIAASTRYEWVLADLAIMSAGAATTTVYPSTMPEDVAYILADSDSRVVFAEDDKQIEKLRAHRDELPLITKVITFDGTPDRGDDQWVISLEALADLGASHLQEHPDAVEERVKAIKPDDLATLIYTSGTTGRPKGVRLRHSSWTYEGAAIDAAHILSIDDVQFLWLPLSHSFGKVLLTIQLQIGFPTAVDGRIDKIVENLAVIRPTFMGAAPRIFEKAYARIVTTAKGHGGAKAKIFDWASKVGVQVSRLRREGRPVPAGLKAQYLLADRLVFGKVRERFGGRVRFFISGSAALARDVAEWFDGVGIVILEGYGLTESSAGSTVNRPDSYRFGTVGLPFPGTEIKIADDGEILLKGPGVMDGYHGLDKQTKQTLVGDGWLATGDIGEVDEQGRLRITDRKKDMFKTSGGKYVAPSFIEGQFKAVCPLASQMVVHGNERNYCVALITLDPDAVDAWAEQHGMAGQSYSDVVTSPGMRDTISDYVEELNTRLNRWETIKKFDILDHDLSIESGELTPSLKVKRRVVEDHYRDRLDAMYAG